MSHKGLRSQIEANKRMGRIRRGEEQAREYKDTLQEALKVAGL